ncbi:MAG: hypothetical protein WC059_00345 [Candidatus Paceibacterota bacterium]
MRLKIKREYLPSDEFIARIIILAVVIGILVGLYYLGGFVIKKIKTRQSKVNIAELVTKDSNRNDIPDWEESLWGLDPTKNGAKNKEIITEKKKALAEGIDGAGKPLTESDKMAREFFALVTSLQESGNLNEESIGLIADAISEKAVAIPIPNIYTSDSIKTTATNLTSIKTFYTAFKKLGTAYNDRDIGEELIFIAQGADNNDTQALYAAKTIAQSYKSFAEELVRIPAVPTSLANLVVELANNYYKTGASIEEMTKLADDELAGMRGLVNYNQYSIALVKNLETMRTFFIRNGILK